ncbi:MAG: HIT domain-containing protein [Candidatus Gracilibacteria bacterium]|jgi:histidine triad (HIT) family protein
MDDCLFCKIIEKQIPGKIQHEDDVCMAFDDIHPKARIHVLLVPKKHISTIADMVEGDEKIIGHLIKTAKDLAVKLECKGYKLLFNVGKEAGQVVFHVHLHLMGY